MKVARLEYGMYARILASVAYSQKTEKLFLEGEKIMESNFLLIKVYGEIIEVDDYFSGGRRGIKPGENDIIVRPHEYKKFVLGRRNFISYCGGVLYKTGANTVIISFPFPHLTDPQEEIIGEYSPLESGLQELISQYGVQQVSAALKRFSTSGGNLSIRPAQQEKEIPVLAGKSTGIWDLSGNEYRIILKEGEYFPVLSTEGGHYPIQFFVKSRQEKRISFPSFREALEWVENL